MTVHALTAFFNHTCLGIVSLDIHATPPDTTQSTETGRQFAGEGFWMNPEIKTVFFDSAILASFVLTAQALANVNANTVKITFKMVFMVIEF